jgi:hypothetical protein
MAAAIVGGSIAFAFQVTEPAPHTAAPAVLTPLEQVQRAPHPAPRDPLPYTVVARLPVLEEHGNYPCKECHDESLVTDPKERELPDDHSDIALKHGGGRFWCLTCHDPDDRDSLRGLKGQKIGFDESYELCGQCHFRRQRERVLTPCTSCHDAHDPSIKPKKPYRADRLRPGLHASHPAHRAAASEVPHEQP